MKPDYESVGGARWMRWTEGVGHSARPYSNTWKPYSQSLDTLGCRRRHMPWRRAPGRDTQQPFDGCGSTVGNSLGQAQARFWSWRSRKWWQVRTRKGTSKSYCPPAGSWTSCGFIPGLWKPGTGRWSSGLAKRRVRGESALVRWAPMELFVWLAEQIVDLESAEIVALACISVACLLRVGEAATVRTSTRGDVRFNGEKGRPGIWDVEVGPWTKWWVLFLWEIRRVKHGRADLPFSFQDAAGLQAGWKKIVGGSDFEGYTWHALRRCGAAVLWGARIQTVMLAGGWVTPSVAKDYCHPTHAWSCERRMHLPVPVDWGGGVGRAERSSTGQKNDLWTICGQDGSERIRKTLHLSDALGLRRVRSAQRNGKKQIPGAHECRAHRVRQRVQQRKRIPVQGE